MRPAGHVDAARKRVRNPVTVDRWTYRELGAKGTRYPAWMDRARGRSGVYIIRRRGVPAGPVLYVGESHKGKLYETMSRHFQEWQGDTAGPSYRREDVWVAFRACPANQAVTWQNNLICELAPRDNVLKPGCEEEVPF